MGRKPLTAAQRIESDKKARHRKTLWQKLHRYIERLAKAKPRRHLNRSRVSIDEILREAEINGCFNSLGPVLTARYIAKMAPYEKRLRVTEDEFRKTLLLAKEAAGGDCSPNSLGSSVERNVKRRVNKEVKSGVVVEHTQRELDEIEHTQLSQLFERLERRNAQREETEDIEFTQ